MRPLCQPRIIRSEGDSDDDMAIEEQFAELSLKLPGVRDVLYSPTHAIGSIRNGSLCLPLLRQSCAPSARSTSPSFSDSSRFSSASSSSSVASSSSAHEAATCKRFPRTLTIRIPPSVLFLESRTRPQSPLQLVLVSRPHPSPRRAHMRQRGAILVAGSVARAWRAQNAQKVRVEVGKRLTIRAF